MTECGDSPEERCQCFASILVGALCLFEYPMQSFDLCRISGFEYFEIPNLEMQRADQSLTEDIHFGAKSLW